MGSNGTKLTESERGVWFSWKRYGICTPHFNRKYELILFRGRKTILPTPNSGAQAHTAIITRLGHVYTFGRGENGQLARASAADGEWASDCKRPSRVDFSSAQKCSVGN